MLRDLVSEVKPTLFEDYKFGELLVSGSPGLSGPWVSGFRTCSHLISSKACNCSNG